MKMMKIILLLLFIPALVMMAGGQPEGGTEKAVELSFSAWGQDTEIKSFKEIITNFETENPNIKIVFEQLAHNQYYELLDTRIAGKKAPDVMRITYGHFGKYKEAEVMLDVTSRIKADNLLSAIADTFWAFPLHSDGKYYGVPHHTDTIGTFYNVDYAKKAGISIPAKIEESWTFDEFIATGKKMREANGLEYAFSSWGRHPKAWEVSLYAMGGALLNEDQTKSTLNTPEGIRAIKWLADTFKQGLTPISVLWKRVDSNDQVFTAGQLALNITGQWMLGYMDTNMKDFDYGVTYLPRDKKMSADFGGNGFMISKSTKNPDASWAFTSYLIGKKAMTKFSQDGAFIPARTKLKENIKYTSHNKELQVFLEQNATVQVRLVKDRAQAKYAAIQTICKEEIELACIGEKTPEEAAASIDERVNKLLK